MPAQQQGHRHAPARGCALDVRVVVFGRAPVAGQVKTRLIPALGAEGAARLHRQLMEDIVGRLCASGAARVELWVTPDTGHPCFVELAERWPLDLFVQEGQDLGARMAYAARSALTRAEAVILVGTDCPDLSPEFLKAAIAGLEHQDAVLGPGTGWRLCPARFALRGELALRADALGQRPGRLCHRTAARCTRVAVVPPGSPARHRPSRGSGLSACKDQPDPAGSTT